MDAHDFAISHLERVQQLAVALKALPALVLEHNYSGESFGSWHLVLRYQGQRVQLFYDGKEDYLAIRRSTDRKRPYLYGEEEHVGSGQGCELNDETIKEICRAVRRE